MSHYLYKGPRWNPVGSPTLGEYVARKRAHLFGGMVQRRLVLTKGVTTQLS